MAKAKKRKKAKPKVAAKIIVPAAAAGEPIAVEVILPKAASTTPEVTWRAKGRRLFIHIRDFVIGAPAVVALLVLTACNPETSPPTEPVVVAPPALESPAVVEPPVVESPVVEPPVIAQPPQHDTIGQRIDRGVTKTQDAVRSGVTKTRDAVRWVVTPTSDVRRAQIALTTKGYDPGPHDGVIGPRTRDALRRFQAFEGLKVTGRLDAATRARLKPKAERKERP